MAWLDWTQKAQHFERRISIQSIQHLRLKAENWKCIIYDQPIWIGCKQREKAQIQFIQIIIDTQRPSLDSRGQRTWRSIGWSNIWQARPTSSLHTKPYDFYRLLGFPLFSLCDWGKNKRRAKQLRSRHFFMEIPSIISFSEASPRAGKVRSMANDKEPVTKSLARS